MNADVFFRHVFQGWDEGHLVLWMLSSAGKKRSECFSPSEISLAGEHAMSHREDGFDVYFGVGLQKDRVPSPQRGSEISVVAVPGLWCDVDFAGRGKKKKYPSADYVEKKLRFLPLPPSVEVHTGGGLHPYWLFEMVGYLRNEEQWQRARELSQRWQTYIKRQFHGYSIDSTHDLSRVLRPPGTWSHKHGMEVDVGETYRDPAKWRRYRPEEIREFLDYVGIEDSAPQESGGAVASVPYELRKGDQPDPERLEVLLANNHQFRRAWEHKHPHFQSQSEYDMSLASHAVYANWPDDQIARLLITHRAKHAPDTMSKVLDRKDYLRKTIGKARETTRQASEAMEYLVDHSDATSHAEPLREEPASSNGQPADHGKKEDKANDGPTREADLEHLSSVFRVPVASFQQVGGHQARFVLRLEGGKEIPIGAIGSITKSCMHIRDAVCEATGVLMPVIKSWSPVVHALMRIREVVDAPELEYGQGMLDVVRAYLERSSGYSVEPGANEQDVVGVAAMDGHPFRRGGETYVFASKLKRWANMAFGENWTKTQIVAGLKTVGFESTRVHFRAHGENTSRHYWKIEDTKLKADP